MGRACEFTKRKMKSSKHYYILVLSFLIITNLFSQQTDKVSIKTVGQGKTISDATANALREAISQAYGVFISANTTIVNDSLLKDEIVSLTTGNIEKYDVLSQTEIPTIGYSVILNSVVSLGKLSSFAQSKGAEASFDGGGFAMNIKLQKLNEQAEFVAVNNLLIQAWDMISLSVKHDIQIDQPKLLSSNPENYSLDVRVIASIPDSMDSIILGFLQSGFENICLSKTEEIDLQNINKPIFSLRHWKYYGEQQFGLVEHYKFRNSGSLKLIYVFGFKLNNLYFNYYLKNNLSNDLESRITRISGMSYVFTNPALMFFTGYEPYTGLHNLLKNHKIENKTIIDYLGDLTFSTNEIAKYSLVCDEYKKISDSTEFDDGTKRQCDLIWDINETSLGFFGTFGITEFHYDLNYSLDQLENLKDFKIETKQ
jgi:hypothetical protein